MTLKQLEAFYWAATCSSFAMAAERVHLSVSSLSKRIAELEASLGQPLFDRSGRQAALTEAGQRLLPQAGALLQQADALRQDIGGGSGLRGPCRIGVGELTALTWLPHWVAAIGQLHPALVVSVQVDIGEVLAERLDRGELDVAVIAGRSRRGALRCSPLAQATFRWCAAPALAARLRRLDAAALRTQPLVSLPAGSGITPIVDEWLEQAGAQAEQRLVCNHWGGIVGLLAQGLGVGLLPTGWAMALQQRGMLRELRSPVPLGALDYALHSRRDDLRPLVPQLRALAKATADYAVVGSAF
tara:strand:+ start:1 stop:900 length:900 start_codon:yes stop_codon:yes gene_type:complete